MSDDVKDLPIEKMFKMGDNEIDYIDYSNNKEALEEGEAIMEKIKNAQKRLQPWYEECRVVEKIMINRKKMSSKNSDGKKPSYKVYNNVLFSVMNTLTSRLIPNLPEGYITDRARIPGPKGKGFKQAADIIQKGLNHLTSNMTGFGDCLDDFAENLTKYGWAQVRLIHSAVDRVLYNKEEYDTDKIIYVNLDWDEVVWSAERRQDDYAFMAFRREITKDKILQMATPRIKEDIFTTFSTDDGANEIESGWEDDQDYIAVWDFFDEVNEMRYIVLEKTGAVVLRQKIPLKLPNKYPVGRSVRFIKRSRTGDPVTPFKIIEDNQEELDRLSSRVSKLIKSAEPGFIHGWDSKKFDQWARGPKMSFQQDTKVFDQLAEKGKTINDAIWEWPAETFANAAASLGNYKLTLKQEILDMFGLSDIFMGQNTNGKDGVQTQILKDVQGNNNLKPLQRKVIRSVETVLQNVVCIMLKHIDLPALLKMAAEHIDIQQDEQGNWHAVDEKFESMVQVLNNKDMSIFDITIKSESMQIVDQQLVMDNLDKAMLLREKMQMELSALPDSQAEKKIHTLKYYQSQFRYIKLPPEIGRPILEDIEQEIEEFENLIEEMMRSEQDVSQNPFELDDDGNPLVNPDGTPMKRKSLMEEMQQSEQESMIMSNPDLYALRIEEQKVNQQFQLETLKENNKKEIELAKLQVKDKEVEYDKDTDEKQHKLDKINSAAERQIERDRVEEEKKQNRKDDDKINLSQDTTIEKT